MKVYKFGHHKKSYEEYTKSATYHIYKATSSWNENDVTWESWNNVGGDYDPTPIASFEYDGQYNGWFEFDVTNIIQDIINGTIENYGFILDAPGGDDNGGESMDQESYFYTSNYSDQSLIPKIEITTGSTFTTNQNSKKINNGMLSFNSIGKGSFQIILNSKMNLSIYSLKGQKVKSIDLLKGISVVNLSDYSNNIYMFKFTSEKGSFFCYKKGVN